MPNLSIKDVPEAWAEVLRQRAARNHRSLQGELLRIIEQAVQADFGDDVGAIGAERPGSTPNSIRRGWKTIEQFMVESRARYPKPILDQPLGVDIIRAERDAR